MGALTVGERQQLELVRLLARHPAAEIRLLKDGKVIQTRRGEALTHITDEPGVFRVEVYRRYLGRLRGWIFSNPIFIR